MAKAEVLAKLKISESAQRRLCPIFIILFIGLIVDTIYVEIYLVRHGIAEDPHLADRDALRRLTPEGVARTTLVAKAFRKRLESIDLIVHSPYLRALETAQIFQREFPSAEILPQDGFTPEDEAEEAADKLSVFSNRKRVMLVSHEPILSALASHLLTGGPDVAIPFKKAGICALEWGGPGGSSLLFFAPPKILLG